MLEMRLLQNMELQNFWKSNKHQLEDDDEEEDEEED